MRQPSGTWSATITSEDDKHFVDLSIATPDGSATHPFTQRQQTHDLTIHDIHTYYVLAGQTPVLVHNSGAGPDPTSFSNLIPADTPEWFKPIAPGTVLSRSGNSAYVDRQW